MLLHYFICLLVHHNRGDGATSVHVSFLFYTFMLKIDDPQQSIKSCTTGLRIVTAEERHNDRIVCKSANVLPGVMALAIICI